jgi:hypothetical protein
LSKGVESILIPLPATGLILSSSQQSKLKFGHLSEGLPGDRLHKFLVLRISMKDGHCVACAYPFALRASLRSVFNIPSKIYFVTKTKIFGDETFSLLSSKKN